MRAPSVFSKKIFLLLLPPDYRLKQYEKIYLSTLLFAFFLNVISDQTRSAFAVFYPKALTPMFKHIYRILLISIVVLAEANCLNAQFDAMIPDSTDFLTGDLFVHKLIVHNECAYSLLDTIDFHWRQSSLDDKSSFALINFTESNGWNVQILQLSVGNYLDLKGFPSCFFGALRYKNKLYVLHCLDSMDMVHAQKYFLQSPVSIKILPDRKTFLQEIQNYTFVVDTMPPAENSVLEWETLTYERFIQLLCRENENCFQCKEIHHK